MRDVCKVSSESLDSLRSLLSECQQQSLFLTVAGCDNKRKNLERYEGEGTCAASPFDLCWLASFFRIFGVNMVRLWRKVSLVSFVPPLVLVVLREPSMR